jgi:hypothetical protein
MQLRCSSPRLGVRLFSLVLTLVAAFALSLRADPPEKPATQPVPVPPDHAERLLRGTETFKKQLRQVLTESCLKCHGGEKTRGGLDLSTREALLKGGDNGPAIVPYSSKQSRLLKLVSHAEEPHMPSKAAKLGDAVITQLGRWIDDGAPYDRPLTDKVEVAKKEMKVTDEDRRFWSFAPLRKITPPEVQDTTWARTPIDRFILARQHGKGLTPNPSADRRKLIRRAYFDLIGLPPAPDEIDTFVNDSAPDAWEKLLDRLLASPHYGERWGRHWLDLARFAESHGFEHDYDRPNAWPYRDFVIKALNQDLPYNQFVQWQIAGDELEPNNPLALTATGFLGAGVHATQITANQVEKERYDELDDIVRTIGTSMLGVTVGCARCHDHKYDPVPTRDYYRLLSTFTKTVRSDQDIVLNRDEFQRAKADFDSKLSFVLIEQEKYEEKQLPGRFAEWLRTRPKSTPARWLIVEPVTFTSKGGATFTKQPDGSLLAGGKNPDHDGFTFVVHTQAQNFTAVRLEALSHSSLVKGGPGRASNGNFALSDFTVTAAPLKGGNATKLKLMNPKATFEQKGLPVAAAIDDNPTSAWAVDPQFGKDHTAVFELEKPIGFDGGTVLTFTLAFNNNTGHGIGRPRLAISTQPTPAVLDGESMPEPAAVLLARLDADPTKAKLSAGEEKILLRWYRTRDEGWKKLDAKRIELEKQAPKPKTVKALICSEGLPAIRLHTQGGDFLEQTHFLKRGDPNQKGDVALQGFLQVLQRHPDGEKHWQQSPPPGSRTPWLRRNLATWLTDTENGAGHLLARVIVNRLWQHHFGQGIVATPSDFGFQGEKPTHPELLDWLAQELINHGWRLKPIHKLMMASAVYTQSAAFDKNKNAADPDNRLLWRHVPHRLEAEIIRDNFLAVSGQLDRTQFGPGTLDPNQKRRSIYFFVKRSQLVSSMVLFDAPEPQQGVELRGTTTIAPQALLIMNNAQVRQCAEALAKRLGGGSLSERVQQGYAHGIGRLPSARELNQSLLFLDQQAKSYTADGKANALALALSDFCQVLLGLNEFVYIE